MLVKSPRSFAQNLEEIPVRFVFPETLANAIPVILISILAALLDQALLSDFWLPLRAIWWILVQALLVGRFTLGALEGRTHADLYESFAWSKLPGFCLRYLLLSVSWIFPLGVLILNLAPVEEIQNAGFLEWLIHNVYLAGSQPFSPDILFWLLLIAISASALLPLYTAIIAAQTTHFWQIWAPSAWWHPLRFRTDLISLWIAFLGGIALSFLFYLPLLGGSALLAYLLSPTLGKLIAASTLTVPLLSWPILAGRLAGTFALYHPREIAPQTDEENALSLPPQVTALASRNTGAQVALSATTRETDSATTENTAVTDTPNTDSLEQQVREILQQGEQDPAAALAQILALRKRHPLAPMVLAAEVSLLIRMGQKNQAMSAAPTAIKALAHMGKQEETARLFLAFGKDRHQLALDSEALDLLGKAFLSIKDFREAGWCIHTAELMQGQAERAGKRLIQIADTANSAKQIESATALLKYYLKCHPDGPLADYARKAIQYNLKILQNPG